MATKAQPAAAAETLRRTANYHAAVWGPRYFASIPLDESVFESYTKQVQEMKVHVKNMLIDSKVNNVETVKLINLLCRLGVSYHFESEIENFMNQAFDSMHNLARQNDVYDLDTTAIIFRVFRQFGYKMSCDVFNKFRDNDSNFEESLANDVKGMLSLYEASHLITHGENILDKALAYTSTRLLKFVESECESPLAKHIAYALQQPFHKGIPRIESKQYISFYEQEDCCNEMLLKLAKIDYNLVQLFYQRELSQLSRWYNILDIPSNFPYARERIAEIHMWSLGTYSEPRYSDARVILTKVITMISILDDTYDLYGTIEELRLLTDAIDRWDIDVIDQLPEYMRFLYSSLLNVYHEFENQLKSEGRSYAVSYAKYAMKEVSRAYHLEAEWFHTGIVPTFDEYLENGLISSSYHTILSGSFLGMGEIAGVDAFEWLKSNPKMVRALMAIGRLMNDIVSHKDEQKRGDAASGVEVYMKQYGASEGEAVKYVEKKVADAWKDINEGLMMRPNNMSMHLLMAVVNLSRTSHFFYKFGDKYTDSISSKDYVKALFVDQIPLSA
ncbi:casbene synthase, chloroplastic-like [Tripterygium wilfordii]|uniref:casbene synthase, chloroplastic-like n=1 Tax=Tripterygium wilfordii TaxID=458696 RepID=UPI0018F825C6|nr:casbene synthase, chloroplastic-like [Tripterygium wilfordii]